MAFAPSLSTTFLLIATVCILLPQAHAFGAGDIPDFAYLNGKPIDSYLANPDVDPAIDKAFRHGDIESILENLAKTAGGAAIGGSGLSWYHLRCDYDSNVAKASSVSLLQSSRRRLALPSSARAISRRSTLYVFSLFVIRIFLTAFEGELASRLLAGTSMGTLRLSESDVIDL
jgi:Heterokaryon incompatibility protein Het-C